MIRFPARCYVTSPGYGVFLRFTCRSSARLDLHASRIMALLGHA